MTSNPTSSLPRQIALDLGHTPQPSLDNFIATGNENLYAILQALQHIGQGNSSASIKADQRMIHIWGESGSGKTHILEAMKTQAEACNQEAFLLGHDSTPDEWRKVGAAIAENPQSAILLCIDDIDSLDEFAQGALFRIHNLIRESSSQALLTTSQVPPANLILRDDLRTRLAWGLVFQMHSLSDSEKSQALEKAAQARGLQLSSEVTPWLLRHFHRDMSSLMSLLDALDTYSLETKRAITLPLVKELLAQKN
ncbi:MAG: DnaA regulatory inactivator Hda [Polynucleobacter sp.]|nr:MAG: DnaA regulatory inactivator Hda [Polynucleobacter sp.]